MRSAFIFRVGFALLIGAVASVAEANAQSAPTIPFADFEALTLGENTTIKEVIAGAPTMGALEHMIGGASPTRRCMGSHGIEDCISIWPGLEIRVFHGGPNWEVQLIRMTTSDWKVFHGSVPLHVGSPVSNLASLFPSAYAQRGELCDHELGCADAVSVSPSGWAVGVYFLYDITSGLIQEVRVFAPS